MYTSRRQAGGQEILDVLILDEEDNERALTNSSYIFGCTIEMVRRIILRVATISPSSKSITNLSAFMTRFNYLD